MKILVKAFWSLPCHRHDIENATFLLSLGSAQAAWILETTVVRNRLWLLNDSTNLSKKPNRVEAESKGEDNECNESKAAEEFGNREEPATTGATHFVEG
jgi:hypothetical protein